VNHFGFIELLSISVAFAIACGLIASRKGRSVGRWVLLGFLFTLISVLALALLPGRRAVPPAV
jgi:uncharacterized membrane protein